jgi:adenosylcobinamide-GDP ribazoletransferase
MTFSKPVRELILAVQFLTRIPTPQIAAFDPRELSRSAIYFPLVGLVIGAAILLVATLGAALITPNVGALCALIAWVWITGGLHLDGLGDMADALGAAHSKPERFHEVLKDPHAGSFAVIVIGLQLIAKLVVLSELAAEAPLWGIALIPAWARWGTLVWSLTIPALKSGMAERFAWDIGWTPVALWAAALGALSFWLAPVLLISLALAAVGTVYWQWRLGGITGDGLGASIEVMETVLLLALVAALAAAAS